MNKKIYEIDIGRSTKYITFASQGDTSKSQKEFYDLIKKRKIIFTEDRGKIAGDLAIGPWVTLFFSENFIKLMKENEITYFKIYPIKFESKYYNKEKYYYIEPFLFLDCIVDGCYLEESKRGGLRRKLGEWVKKGNEIYFKGNDVIKTFYNLSTFGSSGEFLGAKNTKVILITEKLKKLIEKAKLKNVSFEELKPLK